MQDTNIGSFAVDYHDRATYSNFCLKCNAWRGQLGLEPHPNLYIDHLMLIFTEVKRVLKRTGTVWVNMGDSYYGGPMSGMQERIQKEKNRLTKITNITHPKINCEKSNWLQPKQLLMLPERFAIAMQENAWILRNKCIWKKRNPMPSSVKDRFNTTWEYMFFFVKSRKYYFDLDAAREPHKQVSLERLNRGVSENNKWIDGPNRQTKHTMSQPRPNRNKTKDESYKIDGMRNAPEPNEPNAFHPAGKNPGDCFDFNKDIYLSPKYKNSEGHSNRQGLNRKLDIVTLKAYKEYQEPIANFLKNNIKQSHKLLLDKEFGEHKWRHWIRTDLSGAALPGAEDWFKLKEIIGFDNSFDDKIYEVQKLNIPVFQSGRNPGDCFDAPEDYWELSTQPLKMLHFASFPKKLVEKPILAGCPEWICSKCGKIRERISKSRNIGKIISLNNKARDKRGQSVSNKTTLGNKFEYQTTGFTKCDCGAPFEPGICLDPFAGSGTVGVVALKHNRNFILIDAKKEYCEISKKRLQPIFESKKQGRLFK